MTDEQRVSARMGLEGRDGRDKMTTPIEGWRSGFPPSRFPGPLMLDQSLSSRPHPPLSPPSLRGFLLAPPLVLSLLLSSVLLLWKKLLSD